VQSVYWLTQAAAQQPSAGLVRYVLGRLLFQRGGYAEAIVELTRSLELGLADARFVYQANLLLGEAQLLLGQGSAAQQTFSRMLTSLGADEEDKRTEVTDFIERARVWDSL
jgi:tetratricopeptide (TPR) repeat protein